MGIVDATRKPGGFEHRVRVPKILKRRSPGYLKSLSPFTIMPWCSLWQPEYNITQGPIESIKFPHTMLVPHPQPTLNPEP